MCVCPLRGTVLVCDSSVFSAFRSTEQLRDRQGWQEAGGRIEPAAQRKESEEPLELIPVRSNLARISPLCDLGSVYIWYVTPKMIQDDDMPTC